MIEKKYTPMKLRKITLRPVVVGVAPGADYDATIDLIFEDSDYRAVDKITAKMVCVLEVDPRDRYPLVEGGEISE